MQFRIKGHLEPRSSCSVSLLSRRRGVAQTVTTGSMAGSRDRRAGRRAARRDRHRRAHADRHQLRGGHGR